MNIPYSATLARSSNFDTLPVGTVVSTSRGLYRHVGLLTEIRSSGERQVISLNPGPLGHQVVEEPLSAFAKGSRVLVEPRLPTVPGWEILARARSGQHPRYSWASFNCEHFASFALGKVARSPQLVGWSMFAVGLFVLSRT